MQAAILLVWTPPFSDVTITGRHAGKYQQKQYGACLAEALTFHHRRNSRTPFKRLVRAARRHPSPVRIFSQTRPPQRGPIKVLTRAVWPITYESEPRPGRNSATAWRHRLRKSRFEVIRIWRGTKQIRKSPVRAGQRPAGCDQRASSRSPPPGVRALTCLLIFRAAPTGRKALHLTSIIVHSR